MELIFNKSDKYYVSEFQVTANFNLHIEKPNGDIRLYQRTAGGKYDSIDNVVYYAGNSVFDYDFDALVYPKFIKIVSETEPTYAEVVSDGEITEIKSQTKEVEVTANGTTQVAPDAGYSYLTGVTVKTNVPQSGGSGGDSDTMEYVLGDAMALNGALLAVAPSFKFSLEDGSLCIMPYTLASSMGIKNATVIAYKVDFKETIVAAGNVVTVADYIAFEGSTEADIAALPRITKEEFYNLGGGITDKFMSIRELYQPTKEEVDLGAEPQLMNVENCDRVTEVKVNFATEYEDVGKDNNFILFDKANSTFMNVSIFANQYVGMKCLFSIESAESGYSSYSPFAVTSEGTITTDENAVKEINSILANGDFRYIALGNVMNLTDAEFDIIDKFIKVKTV